MRRDDTDIFADKNEGKVLIMDNPFAQTNASHLLIPLMDMAKKSNTQLICLTGLGGESIYNRFDNIYVLNLIAASLRGGAQYLKAEHKRGKEPDELVTARIEVGSARNLGTAFRKVSSPARIPMEKIPTIREIWINSTAARALARTIFQDSTGRVNIRYPSSFKSPL